jgi:hypothetical protein
MRQLLRTKEVFPRPDIKIPRIVSITPRPDGRYTYVVDAWFRAYPDPATAFNAHGEFLVRNKRYAKAFTVAHDPYAFAAEVARAGYATDPSYERVLTSVMRTIEAAGGPPLRPSSEAEFETLLGAWRKQASKGKASKRDLIAFRIPEAPYSDKTFRLIEKSIDILDAIDTAMEIFWPELAGLLGLAFEALVPLAAMVGTFFAIGSGYAEARAEISRRRIRSGFALGVVMGADDRKWPYVKRRFWEYDPEPTRFDPGAGRVAQKAFNTGLATGFLQGREIVKNPKKMKFFWDSISASLTPDIEFSGDPKSWRELTWRSWYVTAGSKFGSLYLKD